MDELPATQGRKPRFFWYGCAAVFGLGALAALAMAPYSFWPVLFLSLGGFYFLLTRAQSGRVAFFTGWLFGFGYFLFGLYWIGNALLVEGNPYRWAWPLAVSGIPFMLSFFPAIAAWASYKFSNLKIWHGFLAFTGYLAASEWLRGHLFTGFPWNLFGYAWAPVLPIVQTVAVGNVYFLTLLTIFWCGAAGFLFLPEASRKEKYGLALSAALIFAACFAFGTWRIAQYDDGVVDGIDIRIVQANISQSEKWQKGKIIENFERHIALSQPDKQSLEVKATYIIWPETAISQWLLEEPYIQGKIQDTLRAYNHPAYLMTGILRVDSERGAFYNSLVMLDRNGNQLNSYDKYHLVPFGEYIPFQKWIPLEPVARFSGMEKGSGPRMLSTKEGIKFSPAICYEIIFPDAVTPPNEKPDFILTVTNDGWYGKSAGPYQHFVQSSFRAVEEGVPVVRAANTGISGAIDPTGKILEMSDLSSEYAENLHLPEKMLISVTSAMMRNILLAALVGLLTLAGLFLRT